MSKAAWAALAAAALVVAPVQVADGATGAPGGTGTGDGPAIAVHVTPPRVAFRPGPYPLDVHGWGFYGYEVVISVDGVAVGEPLDSGQYGSFDGTVPLDAMPPCGPHEVRATGEYGGGVDLVSVPPPTVATELVVTCPELEVSPQAVDRPSLPEPLTWTVGGFTPETTVALRLDDQPVGLVVVDAKGTATTVLPADRLPCGTVPAEAREVPAPPKLGIVAPPAPPAEQPSATDTLLVRCPPPEPEVEPATLVTNPTVVAAGMTTVAVGDGFTPARAVALAWMLPDGSVTAPVATVTAGPDGTFTIPALVFTHSQLGARELVAAESTVPGGQAAAAPVLVVPGSSQPGRHGLVNRR